MAKTSHHVVAGVLLACLSLPASAAVVLNADTMTGTGLPPGQTLPPAAEPEPTAPAAPFTPKTVTAPQMQAWGPVAGTSENTSTNSTSNTSTNGTSTATTARKPVVRKKPERVRPLVKERKLLVNPRRIEP